MVRYKFAHESEGKALSLSAFFLDAPREYAAGPWFVLLAFARQQIEGFATRKFERSKTTLLQFSPI